MDSDGCISDRNMVDYDYIVAFIAKLSERYRIREIAYDRYGAEKIRRDLEELGAEHGFCICQAKNAPANINEKLATASKRTSADDNVKTEKRGECNPWGAEPSKGKIRRNVVY